MEYHTTGESWLGAGAQILTIFSVSAPKPLSTGSIYSVSPSTQTVKGNTMTYAMTKVLLKAKALRSEKGATAVEYGLMVALIAIVIIAAVALIGTRLNATFDEVADSLA